MILSFLKMFLVSLEEGEARWEEGVPLEIRPHPLRLFTSVWAQGPDSGFAKKVSRWTRVVAQHLSCTKPTQVSSPAPRLLPKPSRARISPEYQQVWPPNNKKQSLKVVPSQLPVFAPVVVRWKMGIVLLPGGVSSGKCWRGAVIAAYKGTWSGAVGVSDKGMQGQVLESSHFSIPLNPDWGPLLAPSARLLSSIPCKVKSCPWLTEGSKKAGQALQFISSGREKFCLRFHFHKFFSLCGYMPGKAKTRRQKKVFLTQPLTVCWQVSHASSLP